ncbi:hypothetical protein CGCF415_v001129 [Colletotrichum fructicola]|uniref:uncharacterized protein n=1 Tax=Colletotrichum aenigma TaxID=1215731 RepID=UPI001872294B|nr:uncharacterized protein CGCA056_v005033 [Colletotrichum aenigma]KAF4916277.1 hypothetical protein CGCF415_v001129 [Colletotrichum fructicola]KAF4941627.1 hypothetical protein CGCF245_v001422 [Colletotrichum fructicola]KAF5523062.1 hypothetical protein CGCA056_v005033 [Colletotrichum aenigma]
MRVDDSTYTYEPREVELRVPRYFRRREVDIHRIAFPGRPDTAKLFAAKQLRLVPVLALVLVAVCLSLCCDPASLSRYTALAPGRRRC